MLLTEHLLCATCCSQCFIVIISSQIPHLCSLFSLLSMPISPFFVLLMLYDKVQVSSPEGSLTLSLIKLIAPLLSSQSILCKIYIMLLLYVYFCGSPPPCDHIGLIQTLREGRSSGYGGKEE